MPKSSTDTKMDVAEEQTILVKRWEGLTAVDLYSKPDDLTHILDAITAAAREVKSSVDSATDRKRVARTANLVARLKVRFDDLGKESVAAQKKEIKKIDVERKRMRDTLDALKVEVRLPLTEWEEAEQERIDRIQGWVQSIKTQALAHDVTTGKPHPSDHLQMRMDRLAGLDIAAEKFMEFTAQAEEAKKAALADLERIILIRRLEEAEEAELAELRKEKIERERKDRDERIAREAAAKARLEAEGKARREMEAKEREKQEAIRKAEEEARREREDREREEALARQRAESTAHREKVMEKAIYQLAQCQYMDSRAARSCIEAIAAGKIANVCITF